MMMNEYKLFLKRFVEQVWVRGNFAAIGKYVSTDCIYHDTALPYTLEGPSVLADYISRFRSALLDWHFQVEDVVGEGGKVAVRWTVQGFDQALLGELPPTGHPIQVSGITLYHLQANKIIEAWNCWDRIGLVKLRAVFCACGTRLVALDDPALVQAYHHHVDAVHQEDQFSTTDEQIHAVIATSAHKFNLGSPKTGLAREHGAL